MKRVLRLWLEDESSTRKRGLDIALAGLTIVSVVSYVVYLSNALPANVQDDVHRFDLAVIGVFALEYLARLHVASNFREDLAARGFGHALAEKLRFVARPMSVIELLALLPAMRVFRLARVFRLFRLLRLVRHQSTFASMVEIFRERAFELGTVFAFMMATLVFAGTGMFLLENPTDHPDTQFQNIGDAYWWAVVSMTTVGYGDKIPATPAGRVLAAVVILSGVLVIAFPTAIITSAFTEKLARLKEGQLVMARLEGHVVVCGLTSATELIVADLEKHAQRVDRVADVVVISSFAPVGARAPGGAILRRGDVTRESVLREAGVEHARAVIILAEHRTGDTPDETADARTILAAMQVHSINKEALITAEIMSPENVRTIRNHVPGVEVIETHTLGPRLMAVGTLHRGTSAVLSEILSPLGNDFFEVEATEHVLGRAKTFGELVPVLRRDGALPMAVRRGTEVHTNPPDGFVLAAGDRILVISREAPRL